MVERGPASPVESVEPRLLLATFTVTTNTLGGTGSLPWAIQQANANAGADVIAFNIQPPDAVDPIVISPGGSLPAITGPTFIDGATQPNYSRNPPRIMLDGSRAGASASGLTFTNASDCRVRGLRITNWSANGIHATGGSNLAIEGNVIGLPAGTFTTGRNGTGIRLTDTVRAHVGGTSTSQRNVISGNSVGVLIGRPTGRTGPIAEDNVVLNNYIGTSVDGTAALPNTSKGILIQGANTRTVIGGATASAPSGNIISGNTGEGIEVLVPVSVQSNEAPPPTDLRIEGNVIGLNKNGAALPNGIGVHLRTGTGVVGGISPLARNVISGNTTGIRIFNGSERIEGNFIGLNSAGTAAVPNVDGIVVDTVYGAVIGGMAPGAGNVISGNTEAGVRVNSSSPPTPAPVGNRIQGNLIGTNSAGTGAIGNRVGVLLAPAHYTVVGGDTPAARNVISGNIDGIRLVASSAVTVQGNFIGTDAAGTAALRNTAHGIVGEGETTRNAVTRNTIAWNGGDGIRLAGGFGNTFLANSIYANGGLSVDLGANGPTPNDRDDIDAGANDLLNAPERLRVWNDATKTVVRGYYETTAGTPSVLLQFFASPPNIAGSSLVGEHTLVLPPSGEAEFLVTLPALPVFSHISATATAPAAQQNQPPQTSEYSPDTPLVSRDDRAPQVSSVWVSNTSWSPSFRQHLATAQWGNVEYGFWASNGARQLDPLPWMNLNQIVIRFSESVNVRRENLVVRTTSADGTVSPPYAFNFFAYDGDFDATWLLAEPLRAGRLTLEIKSGGEGGLSDMVGNALDGEWREGASHPSGDGVAGGVFQFNVNVLPGDANRSGWVDAADLADVRRRIGKSVSASGVAVRGYTIFADFDGNGRTNALDLSFARRNQRRSLLAPLAPS